MPNSLPIGSCISRATMVSAIGVGWPARRLRTIMSRASGNCAPNAFWRRDRRKRTIIYGSAMPKNSAISVASVRLPRNTMPSAKLAIVAKRTISSSLVMPIVRPDCITSRLSDSIAML